MNAASLAETPVVKESIATNISIISKHTRKSASQIEVSLTQEQAMENLSANGYSKMLTKDGVATIMSEGDKTYSFYPKSTGGGIPGAPSGVPSASVTVEGKVITKLRFLGESK